MSDSLTALYLTNPSLANALRQQQFAKPFVQEGTSTEAIRSPYQGLARMANAAIGAVLMNRSQDAIQQGADAQQQAWTQALKGANAPLPSQMQQPAQQPAAPQAPAPQAAPQGAPTLPAVVHQLESGGSNAPGVTGDGGAAAGPMQVHQAALDDVNKRLGTHYTLDQLAAIPALGRQVGETYLQMQRERFPGRPDLALAAYNAGPTATQAAVDSGAGVSGLPASTQQYVQRGTAMMGQQPGQAAPTAPQAAPQTGLQAPGVRDVLELMDRAQNIEMAAPYDPRAKLMAEALRQKAKIIMQADQFVTRADGAQVNVRTGEVKNAATPATNYQETAPGVYTSQGQKPVFAPSGRITFSPDGTGYVTGPGGSVQPFAQPNNAGIAARATAQAQGSKTGEAAAATPEKMADIGRQADTNIGNIDYGLAKLQEAKSQGIGSGFFAPAVAEGVAALKGLGVDTSKLGVDPAAVTNVQVAQKTLGVVAGAILQNTIGKDSAITDAKIEHFIHTQPTLATDPDAIPKILNWARSQFVYEREMSMDAMKNVDPATGMLPAGWKASFFARQKAFAPIYDPTTQEMQQPNGHGPSPTPPPAPAAPQQQAAPSFREGQTASGQNGAKIVFRGGQWMPLQ